VSSQASDFQFELQETLYFKRGEEVHELISISLHPEVTIHPVDNDVMMQGEIELVGEYIRDNETSDHEEIEDFEAKRFVDEVVRKDEEVAAFTHRFPVDITIPATRVENMDDVSIEIIHFDYELPMKSKLQFTSTAEIQGIKAQADRSEETAETDELDDSFPFEFEVKREENDFTEELDDADDKDANEDLELTESEPAVQENELTIRSMEAEENSEETETEEVSDVSYLTDIFREEEDERYTKMRICIVQEEDTIESIAERFQVSTLQLIKQNKLDEEFDINEGQLLYIPWK
jgi:stage VI sporulation protein D